MTDKKPPKPFLGDDELSLELDAWDQTFDALHADAASGPSGTEQVMAWPTPEPPLQPPAQPPTQPPTQPPRVPEPELLLPDASSTLDDLEPSFGDDALSLDTALAPQTDARRTGTPEPWESSADETDFSAVGTEGEPAALGEILGGRGDSAVPEFGDDTSLIPSGRAHDRAPTPTDDDDGVYTSASRPGLSAPQRAASPPEDPIAPPPAPGPARRTGPAIIRRTPPAVPILPTPPPASADDFAQESTKIASFDELTRKERSLAEARSKAPTAPPPLSFAPDFAAAEPVSAPAPDEEDYLDIEIEAAPAQVPVADAPAAPRRTVAHVVRRAEKVTRTPVQRPDSGPVIEISEATPTPGPAPMPDAGEDDFSDVALAVGASDDGAMGDAGSSLPASLGRTSAPILLVPRPAATDQELDDLIDDSAQTAAIQLDEDGEIVPQGDAYVPMAPIEPDLPPEPDELPPPRGLRTTADLPPERAAPGRDRPPALTDLYPRVKTPTSVPPMMFRGATTPSAAPLPVEEPAHEAARPPRAPSIAGYGDDAAEIEPVVDLEAIHFPEQVQPLPSSALDEDAARSLEVYERELATIDESASAAALRIEAGRLAERLGEIERARTHYDTALLADPRATAALRGLRRLARAAGDLGEATRQLDAEIAVAGALERRPLGHHRVDLLLASGEQDLARVAVGEILDSAPSDVRALLAQLELAFLDGRADEFGRALEQLAHAVTDAELRAAVQSARGVVAAQHDPAAAAAWFAAAAESDPTSLGARLGSIRQSVAEGDGVTAARALVELADQIAASDPPTAAALAMRAQHWASSLGNEAGRATAAAAAQLASALVPDDPFVARIAAETALAAGEPVAAAAAFAAWAASPASPSERAYAAARAAELDPARAAELWSAALAADPGDDYGGAQLRTAYVAAGATQLAIEVDLGVATSDPERDRARLRAAYGLIGLDQQAAAIELLQAGRAARADSLAIAEALAEALAAAERWGERAELLGQLAEAPGEHLDRDVALLRSAIAWEDAVGAAAERGGGDAAPTAAALAAWERVLEHHPSAPTAHAAAIVLAHRLGDRDRIGETLARAQAAERTPGPAASIALRRARLVAGDEPERAEAILREAAPGMDDPRRTLWLQLAAMRRGGTGDVALALEERANQLPAEGKTEAAALRLRAAQLALDAGEASRATALLGAVERALPTLGVVGELLTAARRRAGDRVPSTAPRADASGAVSADAFGRIVRDADLAAAQGDGPAALALYQRALELRPADPIASVPLVRLATELRDPQPIAQLALAQLRAAEDAGDGQAKAEAYELLAQLDKELRGDAGSAQIALESALAADPSRVDLMHRLERAYTVGDQLAELLRLRRSELDQIPPELAADRAAMLMDTAALAERDQRTDEELAAFYRAALEADPRRRVALLRLEPLVRQVGPSVVLADLERQIAAYFEGDPRSQAAFLTRAGEALAEIGQIDEAVHEFGRAEQVLPGHLPALEGWRQVALKGQLWIDVAEAATREARALAEAGEVERAAALHHFAGVALMDKALVGDQATAAFRRALDLSPGHRDAFLRLRILLEEDASHDELAIVIGKRLDHEDDPAARVELHRALAELSRNFLGDRDQAKHHYRQLLEHEPNDLHAHAAIADIAWEQGNWQEAADSLIARARLEREPGVLTTLCYRLGLIYADRLNEPAMALKAFQQALTYQPDDENTLTRLAELATTAGEWKLALAACERLVKAEQDPDKRAVHLQRVARIFKQGFGDSKRAERALNLALDGAPTNDEALTQLVRFYRDAGDMTSVRVHLNRVAGAMRVRVGKDPKDGVAYRVISRALVARHNAGVDGSLAIARSAAELAQLLGAAGDPERVLLAEPARVDLAALLRGDADDLLFPRSVQPELRQLFVRLGDRIAKHVGVDLRAYGVGRGDRLRGRESSVASHAQDVASALGFGEIDVYVTSRQPHAMICEPTSPVSLVLGQAIADGDARGVRFAAASALSLARASLAIPARLAADDLGVLVIALLRVFAHDFPGGGLDEAAILAQSQKLKRLIPTGLANDLKPFALAVDPTRFDHAQLARDLRTAGLRAGLVAAGSVLVGLELLAKAAGTDVPGCLADPVAQGLVTFALGEDHASLAR